MSSQFENAMRIAIDYATHSCINEVPVGCLLLDEGGTIICRSTNSLIKDNDPSAHAEMNVLRDVGRHRLLSIGAQLTLIVTLEPCPMCAWAIRKAGIRRVVFGARNPNYGAAGSTLDLLRDIRSLPTVEVIGGVLETECESMLKAVFSEIRSQCQSVPSNGHGLFPD